MAQSVWTISWKYLELRASVMLVCHWELPRVAVCQGRVVVMEGGSRGISSPAFCTGSQGLQCPKCSSGKGESPFQRQECCPPCLPEFMSECCLKLAEGWAAAGLGAPPVGGQLAHRSVAFLSKQRLLLRDAWTTKKTHLGLCYRSVSFWNGLSFKCNGLLVVLWGQRVNKIIFVCYEIA